MKKEFDFDDIGQKTPYRVPEGFFDEMQRNCLLYTSCICALFSFHRLPSRRKGVSYASYKIMNVFLKKLL